MQVQRNRREKYFFFYELFLPSATLFFFFFRDLFFNFYFSFNPGIILLSISDFFQTCALFSICEFLLHFLLDCQVIIKKDYSVVVSHIDLCFLSIGLSLCFTWLPSSIAFADRFVRWARNLKALKKKSRVKKSRSQIAWGRGSWFPFQATVEWIKVFMQTAPYNILRIAQTTWSHQPRLFCSMVIRIRNSPQIFMLNVINAIRFMSFN